MRKLLIFSIFTVFFSLPVLAEDTSAATDEDSTKTVKVEKKKRFLGKRVGTNKPKTNWSKAKDLFM